MRRYVLMCIVAVFVLAACAAAPPPEAQNWQGRSKSELTAAWGQPGRTYRLDSNAEILTYRRRETVHVPSHPPLSSDAYRERGSHYKPPKKAALERVYEFEVDPDGTITAVRRFDALDYKRRY